MHPVSVHDAPREQELESALESTKSQGDHLQNTENRRFTYKELEKFTNNFQRSIGKGGFGLVYYGRLEDNTEVAVKMRSESSSHGLDEFLAEVLSPLVHKVFNFKCKFGKSLITIRVSLHAN